MSQGNGLFVPFARPTLGPLAAPAHPSQHVPDIARVLLDAEVHRDLLGHPGQRAHLGTVAMPAGMLHQHLRHMLLSGSQPGWLPRVRLGGCGLRPALSIRLSPSSRRRRGRSRGHGYLGGLHACPNSETANRHAYFNSAADPLGLMEVHFHLPNEPWARNVQDVMLR